MQAASSIRRSPEIIPHPTPVIIPLLITIRSPHRPADNSRLRWPTERKYGYFSFDDADIRAVMRQLSRWYGIRVRYEGSPTNALFWGKLGRDLNLTQVLSGLDKSKVHFQLEGTTLTVLP